MAETAIQHDLDSVEELTGTQDSAHIIVFGNEKGGSGKSTSAMHAAIALLRLGYDVGTIDLDARQGTLTRYLKNRWKFMARTRQVLPMPAHMDIERSKAAVVSDQEAEERDFLMMALTELGRVCDFIVIDTPGSDSYLSRLAHSYAGTLVTPLNDSFIDMDVLADIDPETNEIKGASVYTRMVEEQNINKIERGENPIHWIVMRNRLSHHNAVNTRNIGALLDEMSGLFGFEIAPGFGERVTFKEMFLKGLTLLDLKKEKKSSLSLSELTARQEVRQLIRTLAPQKIRGHAKPPKAFKAAF